MQNKVFCCFTWKLRIGGLVSLFAMLPVLWGAGVSDAMKFDALKHVKADSWNVAGQNMIVRGNVYIPYQDIEIFADEAVINVESRDVEAAGHIRFVRWHKAGGSVDAEKLKRLEKAPDSKLEVTGIRLDPWGKPVIGIEVHALGDNIRANRLAGNLESGFFQFEKVQMRYQSFSCRADYAERKSDGVIIIRNGEISSCEYLESSNAHYAIGCAKAVLTPLESQFHGVSHIDRDSSDYSVWVTNGVFKVYGIPVLWLPAVYKPRDESFGLFSIYGGEKSSTGYYICTSKLFKFDTYPQIRLKTYLDYLSLHGVGHGVSLRFGTEESKTTAMFYGIYDTHPYWDSDYKYFRLNIPNYRYMFDISNVTHITPLLDFRGTLTVMSDYYFARNYFSDMYSTNDAPASYAALEQQFDHFSASVYVRAKVNDFYSTVEKYPSIRFDVPRQELFGTNLYYQGDLSLEYMKMNWMEFADKSKRGEAPPEGKEFSKLRNYSAFRFDTTHFLYYPLNLKYINIIPRVGGKITAYSRTSKRDVSEEDVARMIEAANPEFSGTFEELPYYDKDGDSKVRFVAEFGVEVNTKIYNSWQDVKVAWLNLDGLRHVMQPYLNYTYVSKPTVDAENLYYFDDVDRIEEQHFLRLGVINRLQTRSGSSVKDYLKMENYWDLFLNDKGDYSNIGDFCTILSATPFKGVTLSSELVIDAGHNNTSEPVYRQGRDAGYPGLDVDWINRWTFSVTYSPAEDFDFSLSYTYNRDYYSRKAYSMGSSLTQVIAGSSVASYQSGGTQTISFSAKIPLTPDRRTFGQYEISYDFRSGYVTSQFVRIYRQLHCWEVALAYGATCEYNDGKKDYDQQFQFSFGLNALKTSEAGENEILGTLDRQMRAGSNNDTLSRLK